MKLNITDILQKEMSRTEFLGLVGAGLMSMIGVTTMLKNLGVFFSKTNTGVGNIDYGMNTYGGSEKIAGNNLRINL